MSLFKALTNVISLPIRVAVDVVKLPMNVAEGEHLAPNTADGLKKIERDLKED